MECEPLSFILRNSLYKNCHHNFALFPLLRSVPIRIYNSPPSLSLSPPLTLCVLFLPSSFSICVFSHQSLSFASVSLSLFCIYRMPETVKFISQMQMERNKSPGYSVLAVSIARSSCVQNAFVPAFVCFTRAAFMTAVLICLTCN